MSSENVANGAVSSEEILLKTEVTDDGKNKNTLKCLRCSSKILKPHMGSLKDIKFDLPSMRKKQEAAPDSDLAMDTVNHFWLIEDMFTFENIGFSHTVDNVKYLACADCEVGPIGWSDQETKHSHVAINRVKYEP